MQGTSRGSWLEWPHFTRERLFRVQSGLTLPLEHVSFLDGDAGQGRSTPHYLPTAEGVVVARRGMISCYDHELRAERWRVDIHGAWLDTVVLAGPVVWTGPGDLGEILEIDLQRGEILNRLAVGRSLLKSFTGETVLLSRHDDAAEHFWLKAITRAGVTLWEQEIFATAVTAAGDRYYLVRESIGETLLCLDALTGRTLWTFDAREQSPGGRRLFDVRNSIKAGFPSVVAFENEVLLVLLDGTVCRLDLATGAVRQRVVPPCAGIFLVTETSIFYLSDSLAEFDHRTMTELARLELPRELKGYAGPYSPHACAFWVTDESVIWSDMGGWLAGVSRQPGPDGRPIVWKERLPECVVPIANFPLAWGRYFYYAHPGTNNGLHCYRSAAPGDAAAPTRSGTASTKAKKPPTRKLANPRGSHQKRRRN